MASLIYLIISLLVSQSCASEDLKYQSSRSIETNSLDERFLEYTWRLPKHIIPHSYEIEITPYFEDPVNAEAFTFDGLVRINIEVLQSNISTITLHEAVISFSQVRLLNSLGNVVTPSQHIYTRVFNYELIHVHLLDPLVTGQIYTLELSYLGRIQEIPFIRGFTRGYYFENGQRKWYAQTHFQPYHARKAFPCFDEPEFKATFQLTMNRPQHFQPTLTNMPLAEESTTSADGSRVREVFLTTPRMSTYLVTFHVSEFVPAIVSNTTTRRHGIYTRPEAANQSSFPFEVIERSTAHLSTYYGIDFFEMAPNMVNNHIASPDWASGATENWGLVSYREANLLYDPLETTIVYEQYIVQIVVHEMVHKWFGNLITCEWWDNIWINEGFANFFQYWSSHDLYAEYELDDYFVVNSFISGLQSDSSSATPPLNDPRVTTPTEIVGHFGTITYVKGGSVLLLIENLVGRSTFQKALNYFLTARSFLPAAPEHLYEAFERAVAEDQAVSTGVDIAALFRSWIDNAGYPLVTVNVNWETGNMELTQERFHLTAVSNPTNELWQIPITFTTASSANWTNTRASYILPQASGSLNKGNTAHEWVLLNIRMTAFYRVNYDDYNWQLIGEALRQNVDSIHYINRAQLTDDVFYLMRANRLSLDRGFDVMKFLSQETLYTVWAPALSGLSWYRNRLLHLPRPRELYEKYMLETMQAAIDDITFDLPASGTTSRQLNAIQLLSMACTLGHDECLTQSRQQFADMRDSGRHIQPNLRRHVYCVGVREGTEADYRFLWNKFLTSNHASDDLTTLRGLSCTRDQGLVREFLNETLYNPLIRVMDRTNVFTWIVSGNPENVDTALAFVQENYAIIRDAYGGTYGPTVRLTVTFQALASSMYNEEQLDAYEAWLRANQANIPIEYAAALNSVTAARTRRSWGDQNADELLRAIGSSASALTVSLLLVFTTALMAMFN